MKKIFLLFGSLSAILFTGFTGCAQGTEETVLVNALGLRDSAPPVLEKITAEDESTVRIVFDKAVSAHSDSFSPYSAESEDMSLIIRFPNQMKPDREYTIEGLVEDLYGNTSFIKVRIWGFNPNPAKLLINEFTTKSSGKQCDRTELLVTKPGTTGGFTVYDGIPGDYRAKVVLDGLSVKEGDFIVIWWCRSLGDDVNLHPSEHVWNICAGCDTNPSENNGIQSITSSPSQGSDVLDCVVYSSFESSQYSGFGRKEVYDRVSKAISNLWWSGPAISSLSSAGTRSMFRYPGTEDTDTCNEWKICPQGKATFGSANLTETF